MPGSQFLPAFGRHRGAKTPGAWIRPPARSLRARASRRFAGFACSRRAPVTPAERIRVRIAPTREMGPRAYTCGVTNLTIMLNPDAKYQTPPESPKSAPGAPEGGGQV
jgi:hypothetical protein